METNLPPAPPAPPVAQFPRLPMLRRANGANFSCKTCRHFEPHPVTPDNLKGPPTGNCLRYPPTPALAGMQNTPAGALPVVVPLLTPVAADHHCGEWSKRAAGDVDVS